MFRQGDVLIVPIAADAVPAEALTGDVQVCLAVSPRPLILALGEATGHAHAVRPHEDRGFLYVARSEDQPDYLHLPYGGKVVHEEHATIPLPEGWFRIVRQREYEPNAVRSWRMVAD